MDDEIDLVNTLRVFENKLSSFKVLGFQHIVELFKSFIADVFEIDDFTEKRNKVSLPWIIIISATFLNQRDNLRELVSQDFKVSARESSDITVRFRDNRSCSFTVVEKSNLTKNVSYHETTTSPVSPKMIFDRCFQAA